MGGVLYNVGVAHLKLCASRAFWLVAYPIQGQKKLFDAHARSFQRRCSRCSHYSLYEIIWLTLGVNGNQVISPFESDLKNGDPLMTSRTFSISTDPRSTIPDAMINS